ncbi:MAG: hypothetical protein ACFFD4_38835 [Candidatus Odinarchaeota archaeon]
MTVETRLRQTADRISMGVEERTQIRLISQAIIKDIQVICKEKGKIDPLFKIVEVRRGGSLEKNTILTGHRETDIVLVIKDPKELKTSIYKRVHKYIYLQMKEKYPDKKYNVHRGFKALKMTYKNVDLDVLLACDDSITMKEYVQMDKKLQRIYVGTARIHASKFFETRDSDQFNRFVRLLKYWIKKELERLDRKNARSVSSYLMELMAAWIYDKVKKENKLEEGQEPDLQELLEYFINWICSGELSNEKIIFQKGNDKQLINWQYIKKSCPSHANFYVIDPFNPNNNIAEYKNLSRRKRSALLEVARETQQKIRTNDWSPFGA